jgi:hypothetical protein
VSRELSRRELAGLAVGAGALAIRAMPALADVQSQSPTEALRYALSAELLAVFAYTRVSTHPALSPTVASVTAQFLAHEQRHVQLMSNELTRLGLALPPGPSTAAEADAQLMAHGATVSLSQLHRQRDCLLILQQLESVLEGAYFRAVSRVRDPGALRTIAEIMAVEAQHWTAITGLRHPGSFDRAVPSPFVEGIY